MTSRLSTQVTGSYLGAFLQIQGQYQLPGHGFRPAQKEKISSLCDQPSAGPQMKPQLKDRGCDNVLPVRTIAHLGEGHDRWI
jgi:hypothetical protein